MVRITVKVGYGAARYRVAVRAGSIRRALEIAEGLSPGSGVEAVSLPDPETFFAREPVPKVGTVERVRSAA